MTQEAFERGDWQAVIDTHSLESDDPHAWICYGMALVFRAQLGPEQNRQLQQAALAFLQARKEGASDMAVKTAQLELLEATIQETLAVAGLNDAADAIKKRSDGTRRWDHVRSRACAALLSGEWQAAQALIRSWLQTQNEDSTAAVSTEVLTELYLNACSADDRRLPSMWLVECRSLPRSGHHFLKSLLSQVCAEQFSYCEGYQEPGCCQASPCTVAAYWHFARDHHQPHLRLLKSHDFDLKDAIFYPPPGMVRLILVRRPLHALVSWLELEQLALNQELMQQSSLALERIYLYHEPEVLEEAWRVIDQSGVVMTTDQVQVWLDEKVQYLISFLRKWLPLTRPFPFGEGLLGGNFLLRYEDLGRSDALLEAFGLARPKGHAMRAFAPRHPDVMKRRSTMVAELVQASQEALQKADALVLAEVPAMQALYPLAARN